jgi:aryl-alcohol dehydrogenase-like predicted oxidoreductase
VQQGALLKEAMLVKCPDGTPLFDCVQATWNLLEQSVGTSLLAAHEAGMHVIVKEAMANGRLTDRNASPAFVPKLARLQATAEKVRALPVVSHVLALALLTH